MRVQAAQTPAWTEARLRRELTEFLSNAHEWPSYRDFQHAGLGALRCRDALQRCPLWARRLNLPYPVRRPGRARYWTDARIKAELIEFLRDQTTWPIRRGFELAGRKPLRDAIGRRGGPARWARALDPAPPDLKSGSMLAWTSDRIEHELHRTIGRRATWPNRRELTALGALGLAAAISRNGGVLYWSQRMGVTPPARAIPSGPRVWTDQRIRAELQEFCRQRRTWPTQREFVAASRGRLCKAASRRGGVARWASELGLVRGRPTPHRIYDTADDGPYAGRISRSDEARYHAVGVGTASVC